MQIDLDKDPTKVKGCAARGYALQWGKKTGPLTENRATASSNHILPFLISSNQISSLSLTVSLPSPHLFILSQFFLHHQSSNLIPFMTMCLFAPAAPWMDRSQAGCLNTVDPLNVTRVISNWVPKEDLFI